MYRIFRKSTKEVKGYLMEYLRLVNATNTEHPKEVQTIIEIAEKNGMRGMDIKSLIADIDAHKLNNPKTDDERFEFIHYLVLLIMNDDQFSDSEMDFLIEMAVIAGYPIDKAPFIIKEIYNGLKYEDDIKEIKLKVISLL